MKSTLRSSTSALAARDTVSGSKSKAAKTAERIKRLTTDRGLPRLGRSIPEWCAAVGVSANSFYRMLPEDRPLVIEVGGRQIITERAHEEWETRRLERARAELEAARTRLPDTSAP